ncbi:MAG: hypothetical protein NPIRA04_00630 [Nitrospirales bacterium]|nr:MAG: hypothetical protein NPIRA04_00630 [Nitrospirales bacterium]
MSHHTQGQAVHIQQPLGLSTRLFILIAILYSSTVQSIGANSDALPAYCVQAPHPILITVLGLRNTHGSIKAKLYGDNPDEFLVSGKKLDTKRESAEIPSTRICLQAPSPGTYAIVVHHDENRNKKLDTNWIGLPTEGIGFSNNPELGLTQPAHDDVAFQVRDGLTKVTITLQY